MHFILKSLAVLFSYPFPSISEKAKVKTKFLNTLLLYVSNMIDEKHIYDTKRIQVTFTWEQWKLIENFKGMMGQSDSEVIRNIVLAWLSEKSIVSSKVKKDMGGNSQ